MDSPSASSSSKCRFVCPNDRQLALRAKLKTGWSVKTSSLNGAFSNSTLSSGQSANQPLMPHEQEAIIAVIRRAEEMDLIEQKRVGCLVERLENMRRKVLGRNSSQCLLCAETFGLLKAQKLICADCKRAMCSKCAVEICKGKEKNWLCLICSETREIWKKSGAWFFKSIPKYVLPNIEPAIGGPYSSFKKDRRSRRGRNTSSCNKSKMKEDEKSTTSSSDEDYWKFRTKNRSSDIEKNGDLTKNWRSASPNHLERRSNTMGSVTSSKFGVENKSGAAAASSGCADISDNKSETFEGAELGPLLCRKELSLSRSLNDWSCWGDSRSEGRVSPLSMCSLNSGNSRNNTNSEDCKSSPSNVVDLSLGTMDLSLIYDPVNSTLHCTVYRAKNLIPMDINGLADPYCKLNILPTTKTSTRLRTKTIHKTRNPEFNENLTFYDISESDLLKKRLHIIVLDEDKYGHDFMGETKINLAKLRVQNTVYLTLALENMNEQKGPLPAPELSKWFDDLSYRGQILLSLCYNTKRRALIVTVIKCTNLLPMDNNGYSDPFVKLQLRPDPNRKKYKTSIKWKELNPVWNEEFAFETRPTELATQSLTVAVFDKDYGKSDDYLGGLVVGGAGSKGQRLKHWLDMIRYPDHHHEYWHNLSEEIIK